MAYPGVRRPRPGHASAPGPPEPPNAAKKERPADWFFDVRRFRANHKDFDDESLILGIDEAGRGPVIGDMVYAAALISLAEHERLRRCGVADSKTLNDKMRAACRAKLEALASPCGDDNAGDAPSFVALTLPIHADVISEAMLGRTGKSLNTVSHQAAVSLIEAATLLGRGRLCAVFVDTVGPPDTYQRFLKGRFPHLHVVVSAKADARFPIVSAASIFAKTERDASVARLGVNCGSGYPADARTVAFLNGEGCGLNRFFGFRWDELRHSC